MFDDADSSYSHHRRTEWLVVFGVMPLKLVKVLACK